MDRKVDLPPPAASNHPIRPRAIDSNLTSSSSSSSSSSSFSPPDFLRQALAAYKRHRPLGGMQGNIKRATRVLVPQTDLSKGINSSSSVTSNEPGKAFPLTGAVLETRKLVNETNDHAEDRASLVAVLQEDASITPPSVGGTLTAIGDNKESNFELQKVNIDLLADQKKSSIAVSSYQVPSLVALREDEIKKENATSQSTLMTTDSKMENISSYLHSLALTEAEGYLGTQLEIKDPKLQGYGNIEAFGISTKYGGTILSENRKESNHDQCYREPVTRYSVVGSSCATALSVNTGPTIQSTHAQPAAQMSFTTQVSSLAREMPSGSKVLVSSGEQVAVRNDPDWHIDNKHNVHLAEKVNKEFHDDANCPPQPPLPNNLSSGIEASHPQASKVEKSRQKKKYDPNVFFKVNGKLYQKLGKIGSGGSSEVHKVISSDCTIYALKKIKLKGRDYPTACGFCQEIEYLKKLKGKSNIIQLIDYEVTDKILFQAVANDLGNIKDKRIKDDEFIYMVLEYGEIDLAHMLSQKWKEIDTPGWRIDENWLRFYWQQMLEAVNTIHEERIVHSDLKPANFLLVRGSLKLIDFGIAKAIMSDTTNIQRDAQVGTLNYMSPEAFMCNERDANGNTIKCGRPSDIWSLGCILYQMVYGSTPFAQYKTFWAKFKVVTNKHHQIVYEPVSNPWLIDLMQRCLAWDRNERWRIPQLLQHPFLVPRAPKELVQFGDQLLIERIGTYRNDPDVSRLCSQLHEVIEKLDKEHKDPTNVSADSNAS
ncbi:serine/threonine-protein kinase MPS1 [Curcuma longa]|uniref:serine/threonine-protein kinase MPS1 n=1 Tax=Curcuma longa TaxID=136217 RepID=UPI003D9E9BEE